MLLFYLPPYSPELNLIKIVWKQAYHWRNLVTWTKETIYDEVRNLLGHTAPNSKSISPEHLLTIATMIWTTWRQGDLNAFAVFAGIRRFKRVINPTYNLKWRFLETKFRQHLSNRFCTFGR
jgi:hypothetical protein